MNMLDVVSGLGILCGVILIFLSSFLLSSTYQGSQRRAVVAVFFLGILPVSGSGTIFILGESS